MKVAIVINPKRITPELKTKLENPALAKEFNLNFDLFTPDASDLEKTTEKINYQEYNAIIIGGGDGTVRSVIQYIVDKDIPIVILPLGTFNVLAKALNYPDTIEECFAIIKNNKVKLIDLAEVNKTIVVNHAWLGLYYYILKMREKHKAILGKSRLLKAIFNTFIFFKHIPQYYFEIKTDETTVAYKTCLIFISNNESKGNIFNFGERATLSSGLLSVSILHCHTRWQLFSCMLNIIFSNFKDSKYIVNFTVPELKVNSKSDTINMVIDGELFKFDKPLHFISLPKKLKVLIP